MIKLGVLMMLVLVQPVCAGTESGPRTGNPRGYETDILFETFGFSQEDIDADVDQVYQGCASRDCIPSIDRPRFVPASGTDFLDDDDLVLSVSLAGATRAYPTRFLDRHEIVNDRFGGIPVAVTYCPLCGSGLAFTRTLDGEETEFGVSGLLHNNDLIMYDRLTFSIWQQITGRALAGPKRGAVLDAVPVTMSTWQDWRRANPEGDVLSPPGDPRQYSKNAYGDYASSDRLLFPVGISDARLHVKQIIYGVEIGERAVAVESGWLKKQGGWAHEIDGRAIRLEVDRAGGVKGYLEDQPLPVHRMYWFAWYSFHPNTSLIDARNN